MARSRYGTVRVDCERSEEAYRQICYFHRFCGSKLAALMVSVGTNCNITPQHPCLSLAIDQSERTPVAPGKKWRERRIAPYRVGGARRGGGRRRPLRLQVEEVLKERDVRVCLSEFGVSEKGHVAKGKAAQPKRNLPKTHKRPMTTSSIRSGKTKTGKTLSPYLAFRVAEYARYAKEASTLSGKQKQREISRKWKKVGCNADGLASISVSASVSVSASIAQATDTTTTTTPTTSTDAVDTGNASGSELDDGIAAPASASASADEE
ncbi:hypothetical protein BC830DRAFT_1224006 [Chytriomyces sp. MP71]|nr:hypothetical protein BC830DRAFT_1224006 [Chytriomyces sp. MP71]